MATPQQQQTAPVQLSDLRNAPAPRETRLPAVSPGFADLASFELLQRGAKLLSASPLVPEIYRGAEGFPSCVIALNMALRMQADPLMVMQNLDVIHGRPSWRATFLIACFNQCGRFTAIRYRWQGSEGKDDWGCRAWAIELATGQEITGPLVTIALAKSEKWYDRNGSKWKTIPELMLNYRAAAWMIRTHAPEIAMGLQTREESEDIIELTPEQYSVAQMQASEHTRRGNGNGNAETTDKQTGEVTKTDDRPPLDLNGSGSGAQFEYAAVRAALDHAGQKKNRDQLNDARDMIRGVADQFKAELTALADEYEKAMA